MMLARFITVGLFLMKPDLVIDGRSYFTCVLYAFNGRNTQVDSIKGIIFNSRRDTVQQHFPYSVWSAGEFDNLINNFTPVHAMFASDKFGEVYYIWCLLFTEWKKKRISIWRQWLNLKNAYGRRFEVKAKRLPEEEADMLYPLWSIILLLILYYGRYKQKPCSLGHYNKTYKYWVGGI